MQLPLGIHSAAPFLFVAFKDCCVKTMYRLFRVRLAFFSCVFVGVEVGDVFVGRCFCSLLLRMLRLIQEQ